VTVPRAWPAEPNGELAAAERQGGASTPARGIECWKGRTGLQHTPGGGLLSFLWGIEPGSLATGERDRDSPGLDAR